MAGGRALLPALEGQVYPGREHAFSEHARDRILRGTALMTMVVREQWKLVEYLDPDEGQLFDLRSDPGEQNNRWDDPDAATTKTQLLNAISHWRASSQLRTAAWAEPFR